MKTYQGTDAWSPPSRAEVRSQSHWDRMSAAVAWAVLAPSGHNTQPWKFVRTDSAMEVHADRSKRLPVVDPADRELIMSCAAAASYLRLAMRCLGLDASISWFPLATADVIASVTVRGATEPGIDELVLFNAITHRHTNRGPYKLEPIPKRLLDTLSAAVDHYGAHLTVVSHAHRLALADLIARGDRQQLGDKDFRAELALWMHPNRTDHLDGMRGYSFDTGDLASYAGPLVVRTFDIGKGQAASDFAVVSKSPELLVIETNGDSSADWVAAGVALSMLLLELTNAGLAASFLNQPIEVPVLRDELTLMLDTGRVPQLLLRIGEPIEHQPPTPRIPAEHLLSWSLD